MSKDFEFRPDPRNSNDLDKIFLSQHQRFSLLRWTLYGLVCLVGLIVQDVVLYRVNYRGGGTDLLPCMIFVITALEGGESGCVFSLVASVLYYFSGSAPGLYVIPLITAIAVITAIFRQACLRRGFISILLCAAISMVVYELLVFGAGLFLGNIPYARLQAMLLTAGYTLVAVPVCYPLLRAIGKIGGEVWKE